MIEAIITVIFPSEDEAPEAYTKVYRLEFESKSDLQMWLDEGENRSVNIETLVADAQL